MFKNRSLAVIVFNISIILWIFLFFSQFTFGIISDQIIRSLELEFFEISKKYNLQAYDPNRDFSDSERFIFISWLIASLVTFSLTCVGVLKRQSWARYALLLHFIIYYGIYWYFTDEVFIELKSTFVTGMLIEFFTGVFFCSAIWALSEGRAGGDQLT